MIRDNKFDYKLQRDGNKCMHQLLCVEVARECRILYVIYSFKTFHS